MDTIEKQSRAFIERGPRRVSPFMIPNLLANMSSGVVAIDVGAKGVNFSVVSACATGTRDRRGSLAFANGARRRYFGGG